MVKNISKTIHKLINLIKIFASLNYFINLILQAHQQLYSLVPGPPDAAPPLQGVPHPGGALRPLRLRPDGQLPALADLQQGGAGMAALRGGCTAAAAAQAAVRDGPSVSDLSPGWQPEQDPWQRGVPPADVLQLEEPAEGLAGPGPVAGACGQAVHPEEAHRDAAAVWHSGRGAAAAELPGGLLLGLDAEQPVLCGAPGVHLGLPTHAHGEEADHVGHAGCVSLGTFYLHFLRAPMIRSIAIPLLLTALFQRCTQGTIRRPSPTPTSSTCCSCPGCSSAPTTTTIVIRCKCSECPY